MLNISQDCWVRRQPAMKICVPISAKPQSLHSEELWTGNAANGRRMIHAAGTLQSPWHCAALQRTCLLLSFYNLTFQNFNFYPPQKISFAVQAQTPLTALTSSACKPPWLICSRWGGSNCMYTASGQSIGRSGTMRHESRHGGDKIMRDSDISNFGLRSEFYV